jgi:hypothetical protein
MTVNSGKVRIIQRDEQDDVLRLCRQLHSENGIFRLDDNRVQEMLDRAFDRKGGILGGIGPKNKLEGLIYLLVSNFWYTNDCHLEELFLYVDPACRKSRNAVELLNFAKWCSETTKFPLFIGILSNSTTQRKELLYERQLHANDYKGRFFVYQGGQKVA